MMQDRQKRHAMVADAARALGMLDALKRLLAGPSQRALDAFHAEADQQYKERAFSAHPDRGGCAEHMKALNASRDVLKQIRFCPPPPPMTRIVFTTSSYTASAATTSTGWYY